MSIDSFHVDQSLGSTMAGHRQPTVSGTRTRGDSSTRLVPTN